MHSKVPVFGLVNLDKTPWSGGQRSERKAHYYYVAKLALYQTAS